MKRIIDWVFGITAIAAVLAVTAICYGELQDKRLKLANLTKEIGRQRETLQGGQDQQHVTETLTETEAALDQAYHEAAGCQIRTHELTGKLKTAEQRASLLEREVNRLKPLRKVTAIVVHHSESAFGDVPTIDAWHRERGFSQVGYHYVICNGAGGGDGEIQFARDENIQGAHAKANHRNEGTIGVCLIGTTSFTPAQRRSLELLLQHLCRRHGLTPGPTTIQRHHEQCPGAGLDLDAAIASTASCLASN